MHLQTDNTLFIFSFQINWAVCTACMLELLMVVYKRGNKCNVYLITMDIDYKILQINLPMGPRICI